MTEKQHRALSFIRTRIRETGVCPSLAEIAQAIGYTSKSYALRIVDALVRDGYLTRGAPRSARNLRLVEDNLAHIATSPLMAELERRGVRLA